ncbi:FG-GAP-like repeat-containing protein [Neomicrococcus lactis]|uniref:DUF1906 domain-containing protein n=1 Tax=Neomicrococcus lactis TaxID=732241 RepID=A0A7W9DAK1_9MICC|nr:FG-GAP-like repeat-containing protein [Neomicrococcus lactis]MBB5597544.1 hypothetical protein [Neomicrococcus lactis]
MSATSQQSHPQSSWWRKMRTSLAALSATALLGVIPAAPPAQAADMYGHDISWPQCTAAEGGYALPMPPESTQFVIIGLTFGLAYTENPCVSRLNSWAKDRGKPTQAYGMATYPTAAQLSTYGAAGPWKGTGLQARLANAGYAQAKQAIGTLAKIGWKPSTVWIDVEPRPKQPWPAGTTPATAANNRAVVEGYMRALRDNNFAYGFYSYTNGWKEIVSTWRVPAVPVWATAGTLDYPNEALDRCTQPSFSGGKVLISQWYNTTQDFDRTCPGYAFTTPTNVRNTELFMEKDFDSTKTNDIIARTPATGELWRYPGTGTGSVTARVKVGTGWNGMGLVTSAGDFNGDGIPDVIARANASGELFMYPGNGSGGWKPRVKIGTGWSAINLLSGGADLTGDGNIDIVARHSQGQLYVYPGNGKGGFGTRILAGTGWGGMKDIVSTGDFSGDGRADIVAIRKSDGLMFRYNGVGNGKLASGVQIGSGWSTMTELFSPGDFNGDRRADLLARRSTGELYFYPGNGTGSVGARTLVSTGWNITNVLD